MSQMGPVRIETVQGTPIEAYGRRFTPVVRIVSAVKRQATISEDQAKGAGWGVTLATPLSVIEERDGGVHTLPIPDRTGLVLRQMAILAVAIPLLAWLLIWINRLAHER
jgi:uncharacterized spore protein YtfJ